jgi:uncharacterized protein
LVEAGIGLEKERAISILREHRADLWSRYPISELGIFGSVARNEATETSDVDIVVKLSHPDLFALVCLREDLMDILGTDVDLVQDHAGLRPLLAKRIRQDAVYV